MPREHASYPRELKDQAVRRSRSGDATVAELSRELGVPEPTIRRWLREADDDAPSLGSSRRPTRASWREELPVRRLASLAADAIEIAEAAVVIPFEWTADRLRRYADEAAPEASKGPEPADAGEPTPGG